MSAATLSSKLLAPKGSAAPAGGRSRTPKRAVAAGLRPVGAVPDAVPDSSVPPSGPRGEANDDGYAPPGAERARVTLRLDPERHRRLRVAAACRGESMQSVMVAALDAYLANGAGGCACMADTADSAELVPEALRGPTDV